MPTLYHTALDNRDATIPYIKRMAGKERLVGARTKKDHIWGLLLYIGQASPDRLKRTILDSLTETGELKEELRALRDLLAADPEQIATWHDLREAWDAEAGQPTLDRQGGGYEASHRAQQPPAAGTITEASGDIWQTREDPATGKRYFLNTSTGESLSPQRVAELEHIAEVERSAASDARNRAERAERSEAEAQQLLEKTAKRMAEVERDASARIREAERASAAKEVELASAAKELETFRRISELERDVAVERAERAEARARQLISDKAESNADVERVPSGKRASERAWKSETPTDVADVSVYRDAEERESARVCLDARFEAEVLPVAISVPKGKSKGKAVPSAPHLHELPPPKTKRAKEEDASLWDFSLGILTLLAVAVYVSSN